MSQKPDGNLPPWKGKISHTSQLGGIETAIVDNGPGKGVRIAWVNTGTGLRYKVILDRAMDISEAFYQQYSLAWISAVGTTAPQPFSDTGIDWLRTFGGGLITTCGLSHVGGPENDTFEQRGLHGQISNLPAEIISIQQPDHYTGNMEMSITGIIRESRVFGPNLVLKRTISGTLGKPFIKIKDEVINQSNIPAPHMLLYHINFGWPLVDEGSDIIWAGNWKSSKGEDYNPIFNKDNNFKKCPPPLEEHSGGGEEVAFIDAQADGSGRCVAGIYNAGLKIAVAVRFLKSQLPWLINWQHWGENEYVTALEPATNPPIGQTKAKEEGDLTLLEPGESRFYELEMEIVLEEKAQQDLLKINEL